MPSYSSEDAMPYFKFIRDPGVAVGAWQSRKQNAEWSVRDAFPASGVIVNVQLDAPQQSVQLPDNGTWGQLEKLTTAYRTAIEASVRNQRLRPPRYLLTAGAPPSNPLKPQKLFMGTG
jgi:hypothetical protein